MEYSAQRVRAKTRAAVKRREDQIEQEEIESGELNLIPYLDMVTNLMLFLLASVSAGLILVQIDTTLPDKATAPQPVDAEPPPTNPDDQPLKLVVSITRDRVDPVVDQRPRGHARRRPSRCSAHRPRRRAVRRHVHVRDQLVRCRPTQRACRASDDAAPVFDYRALNNVAVRDREPALHRQARARPRPTRRILMADGAHPVLDDRLGDGARCAASCPSSARRSRRARCRPRIRALKKAHGPDLARTASCTTPSRASTIRRRWRCSTTSCSRRGSSK